MWILFFLQRQSYSACCSRRPRLNNLTALTSANSSLIPKSEWALKKIKVVGKLTRILYRALCNLNKKGEARENRLANLWDHNGLWQDCQTEVLPGLKGHIPSHAASTAGGKLLTRWFRLTSWPTGIGKPRVPRRLSRGRCRARGSTSWRHNTGMRLKKKGKRNTCLFVLLWKYYLKTNKAIELIEVVLTLTGQMKGARLERIWERVEILHVTANWGHLGIFFIEDTF
jgi:hypothetical protein